MRAAPNRRLKRSAIHALTHSESITTRNNVQPFKLLWYCEGLSEVAEATTGASLPDGTSAEKMFFMAKQAGLKTPFNNGQCTIKEEAKDVEATIKQMEEDGEKEVGKGWMKSPSGGIYYSPEKVPFTTLAGAKACEASRLTGTSSATTVAI